jgi:gluconolactonase
MSAIISNIIHFVQSLRLEEKLSPRKNKEIIWFYIFFPCLITYFVLLSEYLNTKPIIGSIEVFDNSLLQYVNPSSKIEIIATGLDWSEGPVWINDESSLPHLLFSDTVQNRIYKWEEGKGMFTVGKSIYLEKSGCRGDACRDLKEPGSNGLIRRDGTSLDLVGCLHGERSISLLRENGTRSTIATHYKGNRLNSPNDLVWSPEGHLYFTDPKYGLQLQDNTLLNDSLPHSGVYMIKADYAQMAIDQGEATVYVRLMESTLSNPNGLAFSPDFSKLYVANSNLANPIVMVYDVTDDGSIIRGRVFYDFAAHIAQSKQFFGCSSNKNTDEAKQTCSNIMMQNGAPDGIKVDVYGNVYVAAAGGVVILSPEGKLLGKINVQYPTSNLVFGTDSRLYMTSGNIVARVAVKTKPARMMKKGKLL